MNALQAYRKIERSANTLASVWLLNTILGLVSIILLTYIIWWKWRLGFIGIISFVGYFWLINSIILPMIASFIRKPVAEEARSSMVKLVALGVIDDNLLKKLTNEKVELWPKTITTSMTSKELKEKIIENKNEI